MHVLYERCCGLDVHKRSLTACLITPGAAGQPGKEIRTFGTMTPEVLALADWLSAAGCTHVAMESTGVYWKPVWNLLEDRFTLLLVNAQHVKAVPGRKSDVADCAWLADLLRHGLLRGSFVPDRDLREVRELTRYRTSLVRERTAEVNRLQKTLEGANIKLASVVSEVTGVSARTILSRLLGGEAEPSVLVQGLHGRLREKLPDLERALTGQFGTHHRFLVARHLAHIDFLDEQIEQLSAEIAERLRPFDAQITLLDTIPGVGRWTAEVILAEIGTDMTRFPTAGHLASWAGMCPGSHESGGKRTSGRTRKGSPWLRKGSPWLRVALTEAAYAAGRSRTTGLSARYHRLVARRGKKKAAIAIGHEILVIVYHLLTTGACYEDRGPRDTDERTRQAEERRLVRRLEQLGNRVTIEKEAA